MRENRADEEERGHLDLLEAPRKEQQLRAVMLWRLKRGSGVWRHRLAWGRKRKWEEAIIQDEAFENPQTDHTETWFRGELQ